jgi:flagellar hook assembly protein FlgD
VTIQILNSASTIVSQPLRGDYGPGNFSYAWNGTSSSSGNVLANGTYTYYVFVRNSAYQENNPYPIAGTIQIQ